MSKVTTKTYAVARNSSTGKFVPIAEAKRHPATYIVERISKNVRGIPAELKSVVVVKHDRKVLRKSSTEILRELRYNTKK